MISFKVEVILLKCFVSCVQLTKMNIEAQKVERELRDDLASEYQTACIVVDLRSAH